MDATIGEADEVYNVAKELLSNVTVTVPAAVEYTCMEFNVTVTLRSNNNPEFCVEVVTVGTPLLEIWVVPPASAAVT